MNVPDNIWIDAKELKDLRAENEKLKKVAKEAKRVQDEDWDCNTCPPAPYKFEGRGCSPDCAHACLRAALVDLDEVEYHGMGFD
jgi:hypothetical protein